MNKNKIEEYLNNNFDSLKNIIWCCYHYNGTFSNLVLYDNEDYEVNELFSAYEFAKHIHYGNYDFNKEYFLFDECGLLQSYSKEEAKSLYADNIEEILIELIKLVKEPEFINQYGEEIYDIMNQINQKE